MLFKILYTLLFIAIASGQVLAKHHSSEEVEDENCLVKTKLGSIQGVQLQTVFENETFCAYRGIPYAKPPIGDLRFKAPVAYDEYFEGTYNASGYSAACYQQRNHSSYTQASWEQNEDCLYINVFVPSKKVCNGKTKGLPVAFYIYGGAFAQGMSNEFQLGPNTIMENCVILVNLNYRMGTFGFLSLKTSKYSGNMGLKDQRLGLKWMHENVKAFGGDPKKVMIYGESSGSVSCTYHTLNEESRKYFQHAYAMSGTALAIHAFSDTNNHTDRLIEAANELGITIQSDAELVDFMKTISATDIVQYMSQIWTFNETVMPYWLPVVEVEVAEEVFLVKRPEDVYRDGNINVSTIYSWTSMENILISLGKIEDPTLIENLNDNFEFTLPYFGFDQDLCKDRLTSIFEQIKKFYFGNQRINGTTIANYIRMVTDLNWHMASFKAARLHAKYSKGDVRILNFNVRTPLNYLFNNTAAEALPGIAHTEDLNYVFYWSEREPAYQNIKETKDFYEPSMQAYKTIKLMHEFIVNYAESGSPTTKIGNLDEFPIVRKGRYPYVELTNSGDPTVGYNPKREAFALWDNIDEQIEVLKRTGCALT